MLEWMLWVEFILVPTALFGLCVHFSVRWINKPLLWTQRKTAHGSKPVPVWAEIMLVSVPLTRYVIFVLGFLYFYQLRESWEDNGFTNLQAFRWLYPESFINPGDGLSGLFSTALILLDTLIVTVFFVLLVQRLRQSIRKRDHRKRQASKQPSDEAT